MTLEQMVMEQKTSILLGGFFLFLFFGIKGVFYFILHQLAYVMCLIFFFFFLLILQFYKGKKYTYD